MQQCKIDKEKRLTEEEAGSGHRSDRKKLVKYFQGLNLTAKSHCFYLFILQGVACLVLFSRKTTWTLNSGRYFRPYKMKDNNAQAGLLTADL